MELFTCRILVLLTSTVILTETETVERIYIGNNQVAIKGSSIQLVCDISQFSNVVNLYRTDSSILTGSLAGSLEQCDPAGCLTGSSGRYTFSADNSNVYIDITNLNRSEDQKYWTCVIDPQRKDIYLTIYTVPQTLQFDSPASQDQDLAENAVTFRCSTGCASPQPSFTWFYTESGGSRQEWSTSASVTDTAGGCTDSERIYTSTMSLARYTTFSGNVEKTVKFTCGITAFPGMTQALYTNPSVNVQFAVRVTSVTLKVGNSEPSNPLPVTAGKSQTLTCTTSVSRPTATIVLYIGTVEKQRSSSNTSFTFTPQNSDHNKQIFCKAFNTQPESQAVASNKVTLDVQVQVTNVTLKDGNSVPSEPLQVTAGVSKTLTCTTSVSRPTATVVLYIGTDVKQRSSSSTSFTFTPQNSDHNKQVYCKAFNTQPESQAVSSNKSTLYVQVLATTPTITNQTTGGRVMLENDSGSMECISSPTRPVVTLTWKKGSDHLTNVQNTNIPQTGSTGLVSVKSTVTFTPNRNDDNRLIYCETAISGQQNKPVSQQRITVYWPPSTPLIPVTALPFLEGQTGKKLSCKSTEYGNPPSEASWDKKYGTQDGSNSRILNLPGLTSQMNNSPVSCKLQNFFTQAKNVQVKSPTISVTVEYNPLVKILEDGKEIQTATRNEGETFSATCSADGNPIPTVRWQGRNPASADLRFNDIDRSDHGTYTCRAKATSTKYASHNFVTLKNLPVVVYYAPDVNVSLDNNEPTENTSLIITCNAFGRPDSFDFTSMKQTWKELTITNTHEQRDGVITIPSAQLQDSGMYTCKVNNGIPDRNQQIDQTAKLEVKIKVSPKVILGGIYTFAGAPGTSVNITVPFYSYPDIRSVKFKYSNGSEIKNSTKHDVSYTSNNVTDLFYGTKVELDGFIAVLHIRDEEESDFGNYTLVLDNGMGQPKEWILYHVSESIPLPPKFFNYTGAENGIPTFMLVGNFNGGRHQTFVIEISVSGKKKWIEKLKFDETDKEFLQNEKLTFHFNITGLQPNTYKVRVLAENDLGRIDDGDALKLTFTVKDDSNGGPDPGPIGPLVGGVVGSGAAVAIIAVIVVVFIRRKRSQRKDGSSRAINGRYGEDGGDSSDDDVMTENLAYVSADEVGRKFVSGPDNVYAQPQKKKKPAAEGGDLYSSVNKPKPDDPQSLYAMPDKKGKKNKEKGKTGKDAKKGKKKQILNEDVYENAELQTVSTKDVKKGAYEENPYENPEETKPKPKKNTNKDGLIYADLTFNDQPKGTKKLVIHGLDDMTEYVEVDFTKKADPLPDSDEETAAKN